MVLLSRLVAPVGLLALVGCAATTAGSATATTTGRSPPMLANGIRFVENDFDRALAEARARSVPLFVDAWAPWCHTCRFLRAYVFPDAALSKQAGRFVWLEVDVEDARNAAFLERHPIGPVPTMLVLEPGSGSEALRWPGSVTVDELDHLLDSGRRSAKALRKGAAGGDEEGALLAQAGAGRPAEALSGYRAARARLGDAGGARVVEAVVLAALAAHDYGLCARTATDEGAAILRGPAFANAAATGLTCALRLDAAEPGRRERVDRAAALAREALPLPGLLEDDRSSLYEALADARADAGDREGEKAVAAEWLAFVERLAEAAPAPEARASLDSHRVGAALRAGVPERALAPLQQSERDFPSSYEPPARLALVYRALGRLDDAQAAIARALARVYGPRTIRLLEIDADLRKARGDGEGARRTLERALRTAEALPAAQHRDELVRRLQGLLR